MVMWVGLMWLLLLLPVRLRLGTGGSAFGRCNDERARRAVRVYLVEAFERRTLFSLRPVVYEELLHLRIHACNRDLQC